MEPTAPTPKPKRPRSSQFSIARLMLATVIISIASALAAPFVGDISAAQWSWLGIIAGASIVGLAITPASIWLSIRWRRWRAGPSLLIIVPAGRMNILWFGCLLVFLYLVVVAYCIHQIGSISVVANNDGDWLAGGSSVILSMSMGLGLGWMIWEYFNESIEFCEYGIIRNRSRFYSWGKIRRQDWQVWHLQHLYFGPRTTKKEFALPPDSCEQVEAILAEHVGARQSHDKDASRRKDGAS